MVGLRKPQKGMLEIEPCSKVDKDEFTEVPVV